MGASHEVGRKGSATLHQAVNNLIVKHQPLFAQPSIGQEQHSLANRLVSDATWWILKSGRRRAVVGTPAHLFPGAPLRYLGTRSQSSVLL